MLLAAQAETKRGERREDTEKDQWRVDRSYWSKFTMVGIPSLKQTAKAPEHGWLEDDFSFEMAYFQVQTISFRELNPTPQHP